MANNLFTLGLDITATQNRMSKQLKQIAKSLSDSNTVRVTGSLDTTKSQNLIQQQLNSISKNLKINIGNVTIDTSAIKQQQQAINQQLNSGINATGVKIPFQVDLSDVNAVKAEINKNVADITNNKGQKTLSQNIEVATQYDAKLKQIVADLQNCSNKADLTRLQQQFRELQAQVKSTDNISTGFFGNLKNGIKDALSNMLKYQLAYKIIQDTIQAFKTMTQSVCDLDKNLTEFNKVADLSYQNLSKFSDKAYEAADKIGRTGSDMIEAATEFKKAGYDINESLDAGNAALVMTNVADGITQTSDAASTLISVLNGFNIDESDVMSIVDKMNSVSNQSPVGFDNLAEGLKRVSGTMNQAGNSIDETIGLLTGGFTQLRNMEKVSTGLTTISQRLRAIDEDGDEMDGFSAKLGEAFGSIGVEIEDANGDLRSTYNILSDYAKVYPELTSEQRQYFGELAAGKHQITVFNAIVDEMSAVDKAIEQSKDSLGSATNENEIYRKSIEGMKNEFNNQFQMLSKEIISSDWIKDLISAGTDLVVVLTDIVKQDDLVSGTIGVITEALKALSSVLKSLAGNDVISSLIKGFMTYKTVTKGIDLFNFVNGKKNAVAQTQNAMNAFFQSAVNGSMQVKDGFLQVGEVEKHMFNNSNKIGFGKCYIL